MLFFRYLCFMTDTKILIQKLFSDLLKVETKESFHSIAQEILNILSDINFYEMKGAKPKDEYTDLFSKAEITQGMPYNSGTHFSQIVLDDVNKIL